MWKKEILEIDKIENNPIPRPGVHPHRWSGSVCLRLALPRLPRLWQGKRRFHFLLFVNWKEILCQYIHWKSISLFLCRLTSQARATMRTSSQVPAWQSLPQVRILGILCWLDLSWQFWLCWSLSTPRHSSHFGRSFPLRGGSSRRYGVWRRSCSGQVKIKGNIMWGFTFSGVHPHLLWSIS